MKTAMKIFVFTSLFVLLAACSMAPPLGRISIDIPAKYLAAVSVDSRSSRAVGDLVPTHARVWLETRGQLLNLTETQAYKEYEIPENKTITIDNITPAKDCILYLSLGAGSGADFTPVRYADSPAFQVLAGSTAYVLLGVEKSPFERIVSASDADGVKALYFEGGYYALANDTIFLPSGASLSVPGANSLTSGKVMNPDGTMGAPRIWINTSNGIRPFDAASGILEDGIIETASKNIVDSGTFNVPFGAETYQVAYFQRPGSIGFVKTEAGAWKWMDLLDFLNTPSMSSFYDMIKDSTSSLLADIDIHYDNGLMTFGYTVVPVLNTFRFDYTIGDLFGDPTAVPDPITISWITETFLGEKNLIKVPLVGTEQPLIKTISQSGTFLYIGTDQGVFIASTDSKGAPVSEPVFQAIPGKAEIISIRATIHDGAAWAAALGRDGTVMLFKDSAFTKEYRFHSGVPEASAASSGSLFWNDEGLVITGTNGVVLLGYDSLPL